MRRYTKTECYIILSLILFVIVFIWWVHFSYQKSTPPKIPINESFAFETKVKDIITEKMNKAEKASNLGKHLKAAFLYMEAAYFADILQKDTIAKSICERSALIQFGLSAINNKNRSGLNYQYFYKSLLDAKTEILNAKDSNRESSEGRPIN